MENQEIEIYEIPEYDPIEFYVDESELTRTEPRWWKF